MLDLDLPLLQSDHQVQPAMLLLALPYVLVRLGSVVVASELMCRTRPLSLYLHLSLGGLHPANHGLLGIVNRHAGLNRLFAGHPLHHPLRVASCHLLLHHLQALPRHHHHPMLCSHHKNDVGNR